MHEEKMTKDQEPEWKNRGGGNDAEANYAWIRTVTLRSDSEMKKFLNDLSPKLVEIMETFFEDMRVRAMGYRNDLTAKGVQSLMYFINNPSALLYDALVDVNHSPSFYKHTQESAAALWVVAGINEQPGEATTQGLEDIFPSQNMPTPPPETSDLDEAQGQNRAADSASAEGGEEMSQGEFYAKLLEAANAVGWSETGPQERRVRGKIGREAKNRRVRRLIKRGLSGSMW